MILVLFTQRANEVHIPDGPTSPSDVKVVGSTGQIYKVNLEVPLCECYDWEKNHRPCKHMMALVLGPHTWLDLPETYRRHPIITLDLAVAPPPMDEIPAIPSSVSKDDNPTESRIEVKTPVSTYSVPMQTDSGISGSAISTLERVKTLLFVDMPSNVVDEVQARLASIERLLKNNCPRGLNGLPVSTTSLSRAEQLPFSINKREKIKRPRSSGPQQEGNNFIHAVNMTMLWVQSKMAGVNQFFH